MKFTIERVSDHDEARLQAIQKEIKQHADRIRRKGSDILIEIAGENGDKIVLFEHRVNAGDKKIIIREDDSTTIPQIYINLDDALETMERMDYVLGYRVTAAELEYVIKEVQDV